MSEVNTIHSSFTLFEQCGSQYGTPKSFSASETLVIAGRHVADYDLRCCLTYDIM